LEQSLSVLPGDRPPAMELLMHPAFQTGCPLHTQVSTECARLGLDEGPVHVLPSVEIASPKTTAAKYGTNSFIGWKEPRDGEEVLRQLVGAKCERAIEKLSAHRPRHCGKQRKSAKYITTHGAATMNCNAGQDTN
jgi:hypothetical protein